MASGTIDLKASGKLDVQIVWSAKAGTMTENSSKVSATLQAKKINATQATTGTWSYKLTVGTEKLNKTYSGSIGTSWTTIATIKDEEINHNPDGTGTCYIYGSVSAPSGTTMAGTTVSGSKSVELDAIARYATIVSATDFTDNSNPSVKWSNPAGSVLTVDVGVYWDKDTVLIPYETVSGTSGTKTFTLTDEIKEAIYKKLSTKTEETVYYYVRSTLADGTKKYNKLAKKVSLTGNLNPTFTGSIIPDASTQLLTNSETVWIKGYTDLHYSFTNINTVKGATVKSYLAICGYDKLYTSSGVLENIEANVAGIYLHDSRNNAAYYAREATLIEYIELTCNLKSTSMQVITDAEGKSTATATLNVSGNAYGGSFDKGLTYNTVSLMYRYKVKDGEYCDWKTKAGASPISKNKYTDTIEITGLDYQKEYTFQVKAMDNLRVMFSLDGKYSKEVKDMGKPVFDWGKDDFNFNVPVKMQGLSLDGLVKALSNNYDLTTTVEAGTNYSAAACTAILVGNMIRFSMSATRNSAAQGNITNEKVMTVTFDHGGKVINAYNTSFSSGSTGDVSTFSTTNMAKVANSTQIKFDINLAATGASTQFSGFFFVPVSLNLNNY